MTPEELVTKSGKLTTEFIKVIAEAMKEMPDLEQSQLASLCIGKLLGTAYSTELDRYGREAARKFAVRTMLVATGCAQMTGAEPDFRFAVIEKE